MWKYNHSDNDSSYEDSDMDTENFTSGEHVLLDGKHKAKVAYFGPVKFGLTKNTNDDWVGIKFEEPIGKHNGTVSGTKYFDCDSMHGLFVRSHRLERTDAKGRVTARVKSPFRPRPKSSASIKDDEIEDLFTQADKKDPLGFFEARAGTVHSPDINFKVGRIVEEMNNGELEVNYGAFRG